MDDYYEIFKRIQILDYMMSNPSSFITQAERRNMPSGLNEYERCAKTNSFQNWVNLRYELCQKLANKMDPNNMSRILGR